MSGVFRLAAIATAALVLAGCGTAPTPAPSASPSLSATPATAFRIECDATVPTPPDTLGCQEAATAALAALPLGEAAVLVAHVFTYRPRCAVIEPCVTEPDTAIVDLTPVSGGLQRVNVTKASDGTISASLWLFVAGIPWTDGTPTPEPSPTARAIPSGTPPCGSTDLRATAAWEGATGSMAGEIAVANVGTEPCIVDGAPALVHLISGDAVLDQVVYRAVDMPGPGSGGVPGPALLHPGEAAAAGLAWSNWCAVMIPSVTGVQITLPRGAGKLDAHPSEQPGIVGPGPGFGGTPRCDHSGSPSTLTVWSFSFVPPAPPEPQNLPAHLEIAAPPTAAAGAVLSFTVLLANLGFEDARLDPCPVYEEDLVIGGLALKPPSAQRYLLDCAAIGPFIAPGRTVPLSMRYLVPADVAGPVQLEWFIEPGGPFDSSTDSATAPLTVVAP